ncbi:unnamed protein product [Amaranthus hypochondriacus]
MAEILVQRLRQYELRLLRCSLPLLSSSTHTLHTQATQSSSSFHPLIEEIVTLIESGRYVDSLSSAGARSIFAFSNFFESFDPSQFYAGLEVAVESYLVYNDGEIDSSSKLIMVVAVSVAAFLAFLQCNFIGPVIELPLVPLPWKEVKEGKEWEMWARNQLISVGSDLAAKFSNLQYLVFAKILLMKTRDLSLSEKATGAAELGTRTWWFARLVLLQQHILDERCSSLFDMVQVLMNESLNLFGNVEKVTCYWGALLEEEEASTIVSTMQLEAGFIERTFGRVDPARQYFEAAALTVGLEFSVTGALGFRTVHQVEPKAQMVLVACKSSFASANCAPLSVSNEGDGSKDQKFLQSQHIGEASDVLMAPKIVGVDGSGATGSDVVQNDLATSRSLTAIQQAVVLAQCFLIEKRSRMDELQRWEMAPYIEAIDSQRSSNFPIKCSCNILRIKWESTRSRTKERALLMMDKVVQDLYDSSPQVLERVHSYFSVYMPAVPVLKKEYGELLISRGLIGEALRIFENLELWDNLIYCYRLLEKKAAAVELIKVRLLETPTDPRLWCSLGDVTNDDSCYEKALEVSNDRSARAKRSLARSAYNRGDYERSKVLWESAMALNTLYPDGWFALGAAALKARDINKALDGFTRSVQLDPDNGEAWNNIACLHTIRNKSEEAFIAFKEALKFKRNSWQMWENYGQVAADVGNFSQALEAAQRVLDLTGNKKYDGELLERIVQEMEKRYSTATACDKDFTNQTTSESELAYSRETQRLMDMLGKVLQQVVRNIGNGDAWGLYARWHKMRGDLTMASEALLKQVRSYQGSDVWKEIDRFKKYVHASLELCKIYMEISSSTRSLKELNAAEMHLRSTIKQACSFTDTEEFKDLQVCLEEVQKLRSSTESIS